MQDRFDYLVQTLRDYDIAADEPWLHGLITSAAMIPDPDLAGVQAAFSGGRPLAEAVLAATLDAIDGVTEELRALDYQARVDVRSEESALHWIDGFLDAVSIHEQAWEELTETSLDAGLHLIMLQRLKNPAAFDGLDLDADLPGPEDLKQHPHLITNAALATYATLHAESDDEFVLPHYSEEELAACDELTLMEIVKSDGDCLPREVVDECARRADAMVPLLRRHLEDDVNWRAGVSDADWWALLHAIHILGLIPGQAAANALLIGFRHVNIDDRGYLDDWLSSQWPALCRNKTGFTTDTLRQIADNATLPWYPRCQAVSCVLAAAEESGFDSLERAIDWLAEMCADDRNDPQFRVVSGHGLLDYPRERHRGVLEELVKLQRPGTSIEIAYAPEDIEHSFDTGDNPEWRRFDNPWRFYDPEQILNRQQRWLREEEQATALKDEWAGDQEPFVREQRKVGRNEPCPCGSGLKYKKCCMDSQR